MHKEAGYSQDIEINDESQIPSGVCFDPDRITLEGWYQDELSAHRARRGWAETLETYFLLDNEHDYELNVVKHSNTQRFKLRCSFLTACARYAFWRLTNGQAPEAQYSIETSHIPNAESSHEQFLSAPDLRSIKENPLIFDSDSRLPVLNQKWFEWVKELIEKIGKSSD